MEGGATPPVGDVEMLINSTFDVVAFDSCVIAHPPERAWINKTKTSFTSRWAGESNLCVSDSPKRNQVRPGTVLPWAHIHQLIFFLVFSQDLSFSFFLFLFFCSNHFGCFITSTFVLRRCFPLFHPR